MFNPFGKRTAKEFLADAKDLQKQAQDMMGHTPEEKPKEKPPVTYYRLGLTDDNRVSLMIRYDEITMNKLGCQQLIDQLTVFMNTLPDGDPTLDGDEE